MPKQERDARIAQRSPVLAQHMGLVFRGTVTTATDITHFKVSALPEYGDPADFPNAVFKGYYVYVLWDAGGAGGAPQGESKLISAYTSSDGTVTHAAFTVPLAAGDEVLLIHPDAYNAAVLADIGDASASLLGSLYAILGNPTQSFDTNLNISATEKLKNFIAKTGGTEIPTGKSLYDILSLLQGLVYYGDVTTYTDTTHFKSTDLIGYGDAYFKNYYVYVVRDAAGAGAAPQGESQQISAYTSVDGTITHAAFTTPLAVTDVVLLIHKDLAELKDILNLTRTYGSVACSAVEASLFIDDAPVRAAVGRAVNVDLSVMAAGDTYVLREYYRLVAMGSYIKVSDDASNTFIGAQSPAVVTVKLNPYLYGCKITAIKTAGTDRTLNYESFVEA